MTLKNKSCNPYAPPFRPTTSEKGRKLEKRNKKKKKNPAQSLSLVGPDMLYCSMCQCAAHPYVIADCTLKPLFHCYTTCF